MKLEGTVTNKEEKSGIKQDKSEWTRWTFTLDTGKRFSTFDSMLSENIHKDDKVEVEVSEKENFGAFDLKEILKAEYNPDAPKIEEVTPGKLKGSDAITPYDLRIVRESALKSTCDIFNGILNNKDVKKETREDIILTAEFFEKWILR